MIADFHNDFPTDVKFDALLSQYQKTDNKIVGAVFKGKRTFDEVEILADRFVNKKSDRLYLAFEEFCFDKPISFHEKLLDYNPVYVTLTWNYDNKFAGGALGCGGLTTDGREFIDILNNKRVFVDLSHLNRKSFYDVIDTAEYVVCSHTAFDAVSSHKRNLTFEQLCVLKKRNVLVGLCFYPYFLNGTSRATVDDVADHIEYFAERFGVDTLCLGTDFCGCEVYPEKMVDYSFENVLFDQLTARGFDKASIEKIFYKNLGKFLDGFYR